MSSEVFRFVTLRPPAEADVSDPGDNVVDLSLSESPFITSLRELRISGTRQSITQMAAKFIVSGNFIDSTAKLDKKLVDFAAEVQRLPDQDFWTRAQQAFKRIFNVAATEFVKSDAYATPYGQIAESIVAAAVDASVPSKVRAQLVRSARALWLIARLADARPFSRRTFVSAPLLLPDGILPLLVDGADLKDQRNTQAATNKANSDARQKRLAQLTSDLTSYRQAADELLDAFIQTGVQAATNPTTSRIADAGTQTPTGFLLSPAATQALSDTTKATLQKSGIAASNIDVAKSLALLEKRYSH
jgi:hypothetical protein